MPGLILLLPFAAALVIALLGGSRRQSAWIAGLASVLGLGLLASLTPAIMSGAIPTVDYPWLPQIGIGFVLRLLAVRFKWGLPTFNYQYATH